MKKMNNKTKIIILIVSIIALMGIIFGATYAYFSASVTAGGDQIGGSAARLGITLTVEKISTNADGKLIPISSGSATLTKAAKGWNTTTNAIGTVWNPTYACKDKKGYTVCQVYEITVKNNSSLSLNLNGNVSSLVGNNMTNLDCRVMNREDIDQNSFVLSVNRTKSCIKNVNNEMEYDPIIRNDNGDSFAPNEEKKYYIMIFLRDTGVPQTDSGSFNGTVTFTSVASGDGVSAGFN